MRLDRHTLPLVERESAQLVDLALRIYRTDFAPIVGLTAIIAIPSIILTAALAHVADDGMLAGLTIFYLLSPLVGTWITAGMGPRVFGADFTAFETLRDHGRSCLAVSARLIVPRLLVGAIGLWIFAEKPGALVFYVPVAVLVTRSGILVREVSLLEGLRGARRRKRIRELRRGSHGRRISRSWLNDQLVMSAVAAVLFIAVDAVATLVFSTPILAEQVGEFLVTEGETGLIESLRFALYDPTVVVTAISILWIVYPAERLAAFLAYLDARIRREGWDLDLEIRLEAERLEPVRR
jgi:hypothetical protein